MIGLGKRKDICSFISSLYYCELGSGKAKGDSISSMGTTSPTEMRLGVRPREEQIAPLTPLMRSVFRLRSFSKGDSEPEIFP